MARITQRDLVLDYIKVVGSITSYEAYTELGITQLGARIFELKERGYVFSKERMTKKNRYGYPTHYDKYTLVE